MMYFYERKYLFKSLQNIIFEENSFRVNENTLFSVKNTFLMQKTMQTINLVMEMLILIVCIGGIVIIQMHYMDEFLSLK